MTEHLCLGCSAPTEHPSQLCDDCMEPIKGQYCQQCGELVEKTEQGVCEACREINEDDFS
jgi:predicted amidophosphoribosyltransferase